MEKNSAISGVVCVIRYLYILVVFGACVFTRMNSFASDTMALESVIVRGQNENDRVPETDAPSAAMQVQVPAGLGAKVIDSYRNELGVEMKLIDGEGGHELARGRPLPGWWLVSQNQNAQVHAELSTIQALKARSSGKFMDKSVTIEGGMSRDRRAVPYVDNNRTPYDGADDSRQTYRNRADVAYAKLTTADGDWRSLLDFDQSLSDVRAGATLTGRNTRKEGSVSGQWRGGSVAMLPYLRASRTRFDSAQSPLSSTATRGLLGGLQAETVLDSQVFVQANLARDGLKRSYVGDNSHRFGRDFGKVLFKFGAFEWRWLEISAHSFAEFARDELRTNRLEQKKDLAWDAGLEASTSRKFSFGVEAKARRYALLPSPRQRFGDGALLLGANDLPQEKGWRLASGVWWAREESRLSLSAFSEDAKDAPIMVAVSPVSARTLPLGGVWTRGAQFQGSLSLGRFVLAPDYVFQDSVNNSKINWQRGQAIPARPRWNLRTEARFENRGFKTGLAHRYQSADALDLGGLWVRPAQHEADAFVGYGRKLWEIRLVANNLVQRQKLPHDLGFQGRAAPNLLDPLLYEREIRLQWEILL